MALSACNTETDSAGRELTAHGTAAFPIACYHDDLEAAPVPWHWHEELELLIASEGGVLAAAAGEKYTLAEGDGLFINAGVLHADWPLAVGRCRLHSVVFHPRLVGGSPDSVFWQKYLQPLLTDPSRPCAVLRRSVDWQREAMDCMERAFRAVVNEIPGYISVEQVASSASISPSECLRCFHDMIGTTPNQYLRGQRLQRAAELLCGTTLQVTAIAAQCGFEDSSYFARSFRQLYGCGPTEFRRRTLRAGQ